MNEDINCKIFLWMCYLPAPRPIIYLQHKTNRTYQHPRPVIAWIFLICNIIFPIIDQFRYFFTAVKRSWFLNDFLILSNTNIPKSDPKKGVYMGPYLASFTNLSWCSFLAILVSDTKMSKLTSCFSILLL